LEDKTTHRRLEVFEFVEGKRDALLLVVDIEPYEVTGPKVRAAVAVSATAARAVVGNSSGVRIEV
jgi:hypothetical protein